MPSISLSPYYSVVYTAPKSIPEDVLRVLENNPSNSNFWIICMSNNHPKPDIDFVLSCTEGDMGSYPIFICATRPLPYNDMSVRISLLASRLSTVVSTNRVYSVFAPKAISVEFSRNWTQLTGIESIIEPYYDSMLTFCTKGSFTKRQATFDSSFQLCPATEQDVDAVADLCYGFADSSPPFTLTREKAIKEASIMIKNKQVWVHRILPSACPGARDPGGIASIAAFTRNTDSSATITKVYTNPNYRRKGCAERLVRTVCNELLKTKESIALYVAVDNPAAKGVYHRVGFVGLDGQHVQGVENWTEIGFDQRKVTLGHW